MNGCKSSKELTHSGGDAGVAPPHLPVLYQEVICALQLASSKKYLDGTLGAGGHAAGILEKSAPRGELLGLDVDPLALEIARQRLAPFNERVHIEHASYTRCKTGA